MIQLYHSPTCPYSRRVRFALELANAEYEAIEVRWEGGAPDWFLQIQPSGTVPLLVMNGHSYAESADALQAISRAFQLGFETDLALASVAERAAWITDELLQVVARNAGQAPANREDLTPYYERVEHWFSDGPFAHGDRIGYLDVLMSSALASSFYGVSIPARFTRLNQWCDAIRATGAFQHVSDAYATAHAS